MRKPRVGHPKQELAVFIETQRSKFLEAIVERKQTFVDFLDVLNGITMHGPSLSKSTSLSVGRSTESRFCGQKPVATVG